MILSAQSIRKYNIVSPCEERTASGGYTYGLGPSGYDLRLDLGTEWTTQNGNERWLAPGQFILAATLEHFSMPKVVSGIVHDKSSLARKGVSVFNTVIEAGWYGYLTLEIVNHSRFGLPLYQGQGIAQVIFHWLDEPTERPYHGKYQNQAAGPQKARP